jgi:hypothetical protein
MINLQNPDGEALKIQAINDPERVDKILRNIFRPEMYANLRDKMVEYEEVFVEFTCGRKADWPEIQHLLIHLGIKPGTPDNLFQGDFIIVFYVDKQKLSVARKAAADIKRKFKNLNEWESTTNFRVEPEKMTDLPPIDL